MSNKYVPGPVDVDYGDDPQDAFRRLRFNLKAGAQARLAILQPNAYKAMVHYVRTYFYCIGEGCPACNVREATPRYLSWVYVYNLDNNSRPVIPISGTIRAWMFGRDKWASLSAIKQEYGDIRAVDVLAECTEEKFQRMTITQGRNCVLSENPEVRKRVEQELTELTQKATPNVMIARMLTADRITSLMAPPASSAPSVPVSPTVPTGAALQTLMDSITQPTIPAQPGPTSQQLKQETPQITSGGPNQATIEALIAALRK